MDVNQIISLTRVEKNLDALLEYPYLKIDKEKAGSGDYELLGFYLDASREAKGSKRKLKKIPFFLEWLWYSIERPNHNKIWRILGNLPERLSLKIPDSDLVKIQQRYKKNISILDSLFSWKIYRIPAAEDAWRGDWFLRWYEEYHKPRALELIKTGLKKEARKREVLDFIRKNPGKSFRELQQKFTMKKAELENILS